MTHLFQYAKSTDPEVIATIEASQECYPEFVRRAAEWAESLGLTVDHVRFFRLIGGGYAVAKLTQNPEGFGRWTKGGRPFVSNKAERERMHAVTVRTKPVPGLPSDVMGEGREGTHLLTPNTFISQGAAWAMFSMTPDRGQDFGPQWSECKGSEAMAAREALAEEVTR